MGLVKRILSRDSLKYFGAYGAGTITSYATAFFAARYMQEQGIDETIIAVGAIAAKTAVFSLMHIGTYLVAHYKRYTDKKKEMISDAMTLLKSSLVTKVFGLVLRPIAHYGFMAAGIGAGTALVLGYSSIGIPFLLLKTGMDHKKGLVLREDSNDLEEKLV